MSVILKGMGMPDECMNCEFGVYGFNYSHCQLKDHGRIIPQKCIDDAIRPDWCPLVEIPEGARLIDARDVKKHMIPLDFSVQNWISEVDLDVKVPTIFKEGK